MAANEFSAPGSRDKQPLQCAKRTVACCQRSVPGRAQREKLLVGSYRIAGAVVLSKPDALLKAPSYWLAASDFGSAQQQRCPSSVARLKKLPGTAICKGLNNVAKYIITPAMRPVHRRSCALVTRKRRISSHVLHPEHAQRKSVTRLGMPQGSLAANPCISATARSRQLVSRLHPETASAASPAIARSSQVPQSGLRRVQ